MAPLAAIGIDVGGTRIRAARIDQTGHIIERVIEPVSAERTNFTRQVLQLIGHVQDPSCSSVGIGIPGRVDAARGQIISAGFLEIAGLDLSAAIAKQTGLPSRIENDATMALLAEAHARQHQDLACIAMVTIGTGIGGAILEHGKPWYGGGFAGQFGHLVVAEQTPRCNCGRCGCVETLSSGTALGRLIQEAGLPTDTTIEALLAQAANDDPDALALVRQWARPLQRALDTLVSAINPELILLGGGLGAAMHQALAHLPEQSAWFDLPIEAARLGDDAGVIGAGLCGLRIALDPDEQAAAT